MIRLQYPPASQHPARPSRPNSPALQTAASNAGASQVVTRNVVTAFGDLR